MSRVQPLTWNKTGNDWVRDGLTGRLGAPELFGDTIVSGATNAVAIRETADGSTFYIGSVNGGVYSRRYYKTTDTWEDQWRWISQPGSGYSGGQSIGALALSPDGHYLAVGQGNPSNYKSTGSPGSGIVIGKIQEDGAIEWLELDPDIQKIFDNIPIRDLSWQGSTIYASAWSSYQATGLLIRINLEGGDAIGASRNPIPFNPALDALPTGRFALAGYMVDGDTVQNTLRITDTDNNFANLTGNAYNQYINQLNQDGDRITRLSAHPELINGKIVLFAGSHRFDPVNGNASISRIDRLVVNPISLELEDISSYQANLSIGNNQAANDRYYGNFSLAVDPYDSSGQSVYAGGNTFGSSSIAPSLLYTGGLVRIGFRSNTTPDITPLYGPYIQNERPLLPPAPGAPHADSRAINFYAGKEGPRLVETDDGGIWQLKLTGDATGSRPASNAWWKSLTANGLNTFEVMMADWGSAANIISSSYQDSAASLGYHGDAFATNLWVGDGQIAVIDDGGQEPKKATGYLSGYHYLAYGDIQKYDYDNQGFVKGMQYANFYLQSEAQDRPMPWTKTPEAEYYRKQGSHIPFLLPFEENAYRQGSMVMVGTVNAYETIKVKANQLIFRPLLKGNTPLLRNDSIIKQITALDNQGSVEEAVIPELFLATNEINTGTVQLLGRDDTRSNANQKEGLLRPLAFSNLNTQQLSEAGPIIDIAHQPNKTGVDRTYWLQGGISLLFGFGSPNPQILRVGKENQEVHTFNLEKLGIATAKNDVYGFQSVTYVPANEIHGEKIVIAGISGAWISDLDSDGMPAGFTPMNWQGLPESVPPGSYINNVKYIPGDDLLILNTLGQGNWIYSFSGDLGRRPAPRDLLILPNTVLPIQQVADQDKRGNELNQTIAFQLDGRLQDKHQTTETEIILHQPERWRKYMEIVSPYHVGINNLEGSVRDQANNWVNILRPEGLEYRGGYETNDAIVMPFPFYPGVSMFNLTINPKEYVKPKSVRLGYSFRLADGGESVTRTLTLKPDRFQSRNRRDTITGMSVHRSSLVVGEEGLDDISTTTLGETHHHLQQTIGQNTNALMLERSVQPLSSATTNFDDLFGQADTRHWFAMDLSSQNQFL